MKQVDKQIRDTQNSLRDMNKLLKMDPGNADLLAQKQKYLTDAIAQMLPRSFVVSGIMVN